MYDHLLVKSTTIITGQPTNHNSLLTKLKKTTKKTQINIYVLRSLRLLVGKSNRKKRKSIIKPAAEQTNQIFFWLPWLQTACQASQYEIENLHPAEEKEVAYWQYYVSVLSLLDISCLLVGILLSDTLTNFLPANIISFSLVPIGIDKK